MFKAPLPTVYLRSHSPPALIKHQLHARYCAVLRVKLCITKSCLHAATDPQPSKHRKNMVNTLGIKGYGEGVGVTLVKAEGSVTQRAVKEGKGFFPA